MNRQDEFLQLLLKHEADVKAFIGSLLLDRQLRSDVFQEVSLTLWRQWDSYDWQRSFGAWARGIAANKILQLKAQHARFPVVFSPEVIQAVLDEFDRTEGAASRRLEALQACLQTLPAHARDLLAQRYGNNLDCEQLAQQTNRTLAAVYQTLSRLRRKLEACIHERLAVEEGVA